MIIESYKESLKEKLPWVIHIKKRLEVNGMLTFFINPYEDKPCFVNKRIFQTLSDAFHQNALECIRDEGSKLRTCATFKNNFRFEKYVSDIKNSKIRIQISKFRLSNHKLMIETGRHKKLQKELRICSLCHEGIGDEVHFISSCSTYHIMREEYYNNLHSSNPNFQSYTDNEKLKYLMTNLDINTGKFIYKCFDVRTFLLNNPKRNE